MIGPMHEEIQRIIEYPDRRIKSLVLTMCSSGIRLGAWQYLKWKHVEPIRRRDDRGEDRIIAAKIVVYAGENEQYFSFITPEAFNALQDWMEYRRTSAVDINGESWVMRTIWDTTTPRRSTIKCPKNMSQGAIKQLMKRALDSEGLRSSSLNPNTNYSQRRYEFKTNHGFRKFFQTNCESKMKSLDVMILMGQDTGLAASYNKQTPDMLLVEYLKAVDNLTIDMTRMKQQHQDQKMLDFAKNQQDLVTQMHMKDQEIRGLKEQIEEIRYMYEDLIKRNTVVTNMTTDGRIMSATDGWGRPL